LEEYVDFENHFCVYENNQVDRLKPILMRPLILFLHCVKHSHKWKEYVSIFSSWREDLSIK